LLAICLFLIFHLPTSFFECKRVTTSFLTYRRAPVPYFTTFLPYHLEVQKLKELYLQRGLQDCPPIYLMPKKWHQFVTSTLKNGQLEKRQTLDSYERMVNLLEWLDQIEANQRMALETEDLINLFVSSDLTYRRTPVCFF